MATKSNPRTIHRLVMTAAAFEPADDREACIIGAILCSLLVRGHFDVRYILFRANVEIRHARIDTGNPDRFPTNPVDVYELAPIYERFLTAHRETPS